MLVKYKVNEVAKDFAQDTKALIEVLKVKFPERAFKNTTTLEEVELNYVFDYLTQKHSVKSFDEYFALGEKAQEKREQEKKAKKESEIERVRRLTIAPSEALNQKLESLGTTPLSTGIKMSELIKRPEVSYFDLAEFDKDRPCLSYEVAEKAETEIKYEGYIARQQAQVDEMLRLENRKLPEDIDYSAIDGLRLEAREKLSKIKPQNVGQASRISGVSPSDVSVLNIWLEKKRRAE